MKPVNIYGPVAWFCVDKGMYRVERGDAVRFVSDTELPVQLLVEHNPSLLIGQVTTLWVEKDKLCAKCVVDDSLFLSLLYKVKQDGNRYQSLDMGTFLNILLPSFSSYHIKGTFAIREISLVDIGQRKGALWMVSPNLKEDQLQSTTCRIMVSLDQVCTKLLNLLLRQRQQANRSSRLCRDAEVCGLSTEFVSASSLSLSSTSAPEPKREQSEHMAKPNYTDMAHAFTSLSKAVLGDDPASLPPSATKEASREPIYSSNDVKQMMLTLKRKKADRAELAHAREEVVKRRVAKDMMNMKRTGRGQALAVESSASEEEDEQVDDSYTTVPVRKHIHKAKLKSRKQTKTKW